MIQAVMGLLAARSWFDTTRPYQYSVHLTSAKSIWILLSRGSRLDTYVKFSDTADLSDQARRCELACHYFPGIAPVFVGHSRVGPVDLLVCRAMEHVELSAQALRKRDGRALRQVACYFEWMGRIELPPGAATLPNTELVDRLRQQFGGMPLSSIAQSWLDSELSELVAALPDRPQHGDFVLNNVGLAPDGRLVVFDWEDLGEVNLPGLDLFSLELSLAGSMPELVSQRRNENALLAKLRSCGCTALALAPASYLALTPIYALTMRHLRNDYNPQLRTLLDSGIAYLAQAQTLAGSTGQVSAPDD